MLKPKNNDLEKQLEEATNNWKRALADYQNLEKRINEQQGDFVKFSNKELILKLLPVLDSLEQLANHLDDEGIKLVYHQFSDILAREDLQKIEVLGKEFDPQVMESVDVLEGEENKVLKVTRNGYNFKGKLLRPAQVIVGKEKIEKQSEELAKEQVPKGDYM